MHIDILIGFLLGIIILIISIIVKRKDIQNIGNLGLIVLESFISGLTLYLGFSAIYYGVSGVVLFGEEKIAAQEVMVGFSGFLIVFVTLIALFRNEITKKINLDDKFSIKKSFIKIKKIHDYLKYKNDTQNIELKVLRYNGGSFMVDTKDLKENLSTGMHFSLKTWESCEVGGEIKDVPTPDLAYCKVEDVQDISEFKILKWKRKGKKMKIFKEKIKSNTIKSFFKLKPNPHYDKYNFQDIKEIYKNLNKLKDIEV